MLCYYGLKGYYFLQWLLESSGSSCPRHDEGGGPALQAVRLGPVARQHGMGQDPPDMDGLLKMGCLCPYPDPRKDPTSRSPKSGL